MKKVNEELLQNYGERIRAERDKLGLTQDKLAKELGFQSKQQICNYESANRQPDYSTLLKISRFFNVSTDYLLGNAESKNIENTEISRKLGLTDKSIEKLSSYTEKNCWNMDIFNDSKIGMKYYSTIINKIIENENFENLIYFIRKYINSFKIEKLKKEIELNKVLYTDPDTNKDITNKDILMQQENYNIENEESSTDMYAYKINTIFNKIIETIVTQLEPSFSEQWTLNEDKTEIINICKDNSADFKFLKRRY